MRPTIEQQQSQLCKSHVFVLVTMNSEGTECDDNHVREETISDHIQNNIESQNSPLLASSANKKQVLLSISMPKRLREITSGKVLMH